MSGHMAKCMKGESTSRLTDDEIRHAAGLLHRALVHDQSRFVVEMIARQLGCRPQQVAAAAALFAEGSTVPFVARYRKEVTGGLLDEQLETVDKQRTYYLELAERRDAVLASIAEQGKLTDELEAAIRACLTKQELEDLYLPYKPKRRTKAMIARENGLEPLADAILGDRNADPEGLAAGYVSDAVPNVQKNNIVEFS